MGPLTFLESITEVPGKSLKLANCLAFLTLSQATIIMAEAITTIQMQKKLHKSPGIALTTYHSQRIQTSW